MYTKVSVFIAIPQASWPKILSVPLMQMPHVLLISSSLILSLRYAKSTNNEALHTFLFSLLLFPPF
jgi:hypothetical protein